jgi:hypothetical protein
MTLRWGVRTGTGTFTPLPLVAVPRPLDAALVRRPDVPAPDAPVVLAPELRPAEPRVPDVLPALLVDALLVDALLVEALLVDALPVDAPLPDGLPAALDVPPPEVRALDVRALAVAPPEVRAADVRALEVRALDPPPVVRPPEVLLPDVPPPDVPPLDVPPLDVPLPDVLAAEVVVRAEALRGAVFSLVARPASAIPAHPPAHVSERVVRLSPRCFREWATPSVRRQIQTDLFPGHGGAMGSGVTSPPGHCRRPGPSSPPMAGTILRPAVSHRRLRS